jgi:arginine/glutamate-rich protein 1
MVEEETAKRIEELVKKRVEEELEKRKEEIEAEVLRRVEEAKKIMEKQMMEEMERRREQQLEEEKKREVRQKGNSVGVELWLGRAMCNGLISISWEDIQNCMFCNYSVLFLK